MANLENELTITKSIYKSMMPKNNQSVSPLAIPDTWRDENGKLVANWNDTDENFAVEFKMATKVMTGQRHEWDEEEEEWVDGEMMTTSELLSLIADKRLLFC